jgi:hypothetical protein
MYAGGSLGLAVLRRDGFVSLDADETGGYLTTSPVMFNGDNLFVNVDNIDGELTIEILDQNYKPISPYTKDNFQKISANSTIEAAYWKKSPGLKKLKGKIVRFKFYLRKGSLYSFWVTPDKLGASYGYLAAGGPGYDGNRDTKGKRVYDAKNKD